MRPTRGRRTLLGRGSRAPRVGGARRPTAEGDGRLDSGAIRFAKYLELEDAQRRSSMKRIAVIFAASERPAREVVLMS
jgi:hypothetical protein